jgi:hypothetical protein
VRERDAADHLRRQRPERAAAQRDAAEQVGAVEAAAHPECQGEASFARRLGALLAVVREAETVDAGDQSALGNPERGREPGGVAARLSAELRRDAQVAPREPGARAYRL